jgi:hypothetical protein
MNSSMTWPDAVAQLTSARTKAETCVALLKKYGNETQVSRGQLTYTNAKADADAVIAGLIVALFRRATAGKPIEFASQIE